MKTARKRAEEWLAARSYKTIRPSDLADLLKHYAADAIYLASERVETVMEDAEYSRTAIGVAVGAVTNTPFPGEGQ